MPGDKQDDKDSIKTEVNEQDEKNEQDEVNEQDNKENKNRTSVKEKRKSKRASDVKKDDDGKKEDKLKRASAVKKDDDDLKKDDKSNRSSEANNQQEELSSSDNECDPTSSETDGTLAGSSMVATFDPFQGDEELRKELVNRISRMSALQLKDFMMEPVPPGIWLECYIDRVSLGRTRFSRKFHFLVEGGVHLAVAEKRKRNATAHYIVSTSPIDVDRDNDFCVGKVRSNFFGSEFHAYDLGLNPKSLNKAKSTTKGAELQSEVREELMALNFEHAFFGGKKVSGPRGMHVVLPHVRETAAGGHERIPCKPIAPNTDGLIPLKNHWAQSTVMRGEEPLVRAYDSKLATWNKRMKSYVLNFNSRIKKASVKNFQLVPADDANDVVLQFGRSGKDNRFVLDFRYPLSPFQALSIAVCTMDYKLCSE